MIETGAMSTPEKALADRIQIRGPLRDIDNLDTRALSDRRERLPELAAVVADQVPRAFAPSSCLPQLLCNPPIARGARDIEVDDLGGRMADDEERKDGPELCIVELEEITGPELSDVVIEKTRPSLP